MAGEGITFPYPHGKDCLMNYFKVVASIGLVVANARGTLLCHYITDLCFAIQHNFAIVFIQMPVP